MSDKKFLKVLQGEQYERPPFWFMRQAGRYLPEYRELRTKAGGFLDMVYNPEFATEVTMQPLRRFGMDAAILFSDILVIPHALGQKLTFITGEGPKLEAIETADGLVKLCEDALDDVLQPVYDTVKNLRSQIVQEKMTDTALIGFAGAPWTVATYMVEGGGSKTFEKVKAFAYRDPAGFAQLIDIVTNSTIHYLKKQIEYGAEAIQIFDSWAGVLDQDQFAQWVMLPTIRIVTALKESYPDVPVIGFPKGAGILYESYAQNTGIDAVGLDTQVPTKWAAEVLQTELTVQGNLDPVALLVGGDAMEKETRRILEDLSAGPYIFNLGHGVIKETPPEHVDQLAKFIRGEA